MSMSSWRPVDTRRCWLAGACWSVAGACECAACLTVCACVCALQLEGAQLRVAAAGVGVGPDVVRQACMHCVCCSDALPPSQVHARRATRSGSAGAHAVWHVRRFFCLHVHLCVCVQNSQVDASWVARLPAHAARVLGVLSERVAALHDRSVDIVTQRSLCLSLSLSVSLHSYSVTLCVLIVCLTLVGSGWWRGGDAVRDVVALLVAERPSLFGLELGAESVDAVARWIGTEAWPGEICARCVCV